MSTNDLATRDLKRRIFKVGFVLLIAVLILGGAIFTALVRNGISLYAISGNSMEPTFSDKDSVILQQADKIGKDQVIFFDQPNKWNDYVKNDHILVKRVIAVPGDVLSFDGTSFSVNDEEIFNVKDNEYECSSAPKDYSYELSNKEIFVMGDNHSNSLDSRRIFCDGDVEDAFVPVQSVRNYGEVIFEF